jgi:hypothetical protein
MLVEAAGPTPERLAHAHGAFQIGGMARSARVFRMLDAPIERLLFESRITESQHEALRQLRTHWFLGQVAATPRSVDLDRVVARDQDNRAPGELVLVHRQAFRAAWRILRSAERQVVHDVVLFELPLHVAGVGLGYTSPYRARHGAFELVQSAADQLRWFWRIG